MLLKHFMFTVRNDGDLQIVGTISAALVLHLHIFTSIIRL